MSVDISRLRAPTLIRPVPRAPAVKVEPLLNPDTTPMGANIVPDKSGATFRCWAPRAQSVRIVGEFNNWLDTPDTELIRQPDGRWGGFIRGARDGQQYKFHVEGAGTDGLKRDPYAREFTATDPSWPDSHCVLRDADAYPWRVRDFRPPCFNDLIIYQLHVGVFNGNNRPHRPAKFLDVLGRLDKLASTGVNAIQLLPIVEFSSPRSEGYEGADIFSAEQDYTASDDELSAYLPMVNGLFNARGLPGLARDDIRSHCAQLKVLIDLCHAWGIAVFLDVVYNHAGGQMTTQQQSIWFFDRLSGTDPRDSLFFNDRNYCGPEWAIELQTVSQRNDPGERQVVQQAVQQYLIDNVVSFIEEYQIDGLRYDQASVVVADNANEGWRFWQNLTDTARHIDPSVIHIAEYWNVDPWVVRSRSAGGAGFDACWHDGLRSSIRDAIKAASYGAGSFVDVERIAANLWPAGFPEAWRAIQYIECHDTVIVGREARIPALADGSDSRSPFATGRARVAAGILMTAPGIPMLFMGQEILEDRPWTDDPGAHPDDLIDWGEVDYGKVPAACDYYAFIQGLTGLRAAQPALRGNQLHVIHASNATRVLAFHRWLDGEGRDLVVVVSLNDDNYPEYELGFPGSGPWKEVFNSAFTDGGNPFGVEAWDSSVHGMPATARITIPRRSILVFSR